MTKAEMKKEILKTITTDEFEKRLEQLIDWNTEKKAIAIIFEEIFENTTDTNEMMFNTFYAIG